MTGFLSFFKSNLEEIVSPLFGINYSIGFFLSFFIILSLFIFRNFYAKVSKCNIFRYFLGTIQLILYILYFVLHHLSGDILWKDYMPFQLCSLLDLTSAFLLFFPFEKFFSMTFPLIGPVALAFLLPDVTKRVYGFSNFFFYQYYLNHIIIFFGYFYLYLYGHTKFNTGFLKHTCVSMTFFALLIFVFNISVGTNFLFIGSAGFIFSNKYWFLSTGNWNPVLRFLFIWIVGLSFVLLFKYLIANFLPPFYLNKGSEKNSFYENKKNMKNNNKKTFQKNKKQVLKLRR